jgi:hypothetical protein
VAAADPSLHRISFDFHRSGNGIRRRFAKDIRQLFVVGMRLTFGGVISRIEPENEDAMVGRYRVQLWTPVIGRNDPLLCPLWQFLMRVMGIEAYTIRMEQADPPDVRFSERFFISRHHDEEGRDWSGDADLVDDTDSVISIESIPFFPG